MNKGKPLCDFCSKSTGRQEYVGYGMVACKKCIAKHLVRMPGGFRFKTSAEKNCDSNRKT